MRKVEEMIKEEGLWSGLNRPQISMENADIVVFGIPFDGGVSFRAGAKDGPRELREITYSIYPITERWESFSDLKVLDLGDIEGKDREKIFKKAEEIAYQAIKAKKLLTMIGGDHSTTIPVLRGIDKVLDEPLGIIHLDAHFDLCDEIDGNYFSHGSTSGALVVLSAV
ncbi:Guanidinobutyrase [subsurface metagenome]